MGRICRLWISSAEAVRARTVCGRSACWFDWRALRPFYGTNQNYKEMRDADRRTGRTGVFVRPRFGIWENVVGALSSGRDPATGQKQPGADFQKVLEAFLQVEEPYLHVVRPEAGRWEYSGAVLGVRSCVAWITWDAQYLGVPQRRRRIFAVADFAGYSPIPILAVPESVPGYAAPCGLPWQVASGIIRNSACDAGRIDPSWAYSG